MPKSTKKKKDKAADFSKAKLKLGKGKQVANNAVDTSFKARSIALPSQSISHDKDSATPSTRRRLTFDDLISHLKHYSANTRRDAILGLRELLEAHQELIGLHLTTLINSCVRVIGDEDASVRKGLLSFFAWLLRQVPLEDLTPHAPVLLLFATSAQTHIFPEIRIDAVRFLDLFLEHVPQVVVEGWTQSNGGHGRRVLEGYLGILNAGTTFGEGGDNGPVQATSTASVVLSPSSKLMVLKSLSSFLAQALSSPGASTSTSAAPTWYLSSSFSSPESFETFDKLLHPTLSVSPNEPKRQSYSRLSKRWSEEADYDEIAEDFVGNFEFSTATSGWSLQDLTNLDIAGSLDSGSQGTSSVESAYISHLARTLHSTLVSSFLDCAPSVFSPSASPPETELQLVLTVGNICRTLYGAILQDTVETGKSRESDAEDLKDILGYLAPYFPFTPSGVNMRRDIKIEQTFQDLNLIFCELTSLLVLSPSSFPHTHPRTGRAKTRKRTGHTNSSLQFDRVSTYVVQLLRGEAPSGPAHASLTRPISAAAYTSLLPTIWSLVCSDAKGEDETSVFSVVIEHAIKASSSSAVKKPAVDFLARLVLLESELEYKGPFRVRNTDKASKLHEWILQLPRTLWELGASNLALTEIIFRLLLRLLQRHILPSTIPQLHVRLAPYFIIAHPTRGRLPGPWVKLTPALRRLALDVIGTLGAGEADEAVGEAVSGTEEAGYWAAVRAATRA